MRRSVAMFSKWQVGAYCIKEKEETKIYRAPCHWVLNPLSNLMKWVFYTPFKDEETEANSLSKQQS